MTTMAENDGSNSPSWLKQRSTLFNNSSPSASSTTSASAAKPAPKVVDKELARLKNIGAVSSVWSNKFVQEDNSGGTTENKHTSPPPLSPRQRFMLNNIDISPRPNANYNPGNNTSFRSSMTSPPPQPTSPRSPAFSARARTLSGNNKKLADDIHTALEQAEKNSNNRNSNNSNYGYFSKASVSSLDLNETSLEMNHSSSKSIRSSTSSATTSSVPPSPVNQVSSDSYLLNTPRKISSANSVSSVNTSIDEAASLWFQCETLKTQYAQSSARLTRANEDIEFYKRQLEQQAEVSREGIASAMEEKEKEALRVRQLAELIVKQDKLLGEYEINLDFLTKLTNESVYLEQSQAEMDGLRQELSTLNKKKIDMEGSIAALRAELEMSRGQMKLMMAVSTEIQNEFASYKGKIDAEVRELLSRKNREHQLELQALQEQVSAINETNSVTDRSMVMTNENQDDIIAKHVAAATAAASASAAISAAENEKSISSLHEQVSSLTQTLYEKDESVTKLLEAKNKAMAEALQSKDKDMIEALESKDKAIAEALKAKDQVIKEALEGKDKTIADLENQLKTQKMSMDAQMMELNQTILQKDALLMEFMSSRNNSREVIAAAASMSPSTVVPAASVTNTYYHSNQSEAQLQMSQVRDYMLSASSDEEEDDELTETIRMSYSSDEEEDHVQQMHGHYRHMMNNNDNRNNTPQSPAETISSSISFDSDEEEEKVAEIKRFSYNSVQSQGTRPISLISTSESISSSNNDRSSLRSSSGIPFSVAKEASNASWPMPPPTPPPSEPLPPVPSVQIEDTNVTATVESIAPKEEVKPSSPIAQMVSTIPPPRRARSKTMARDEAPNMSSYTTSVHQTNELPRIVSLQDQNTVEQESSSSPVPPPRKDLPNLTISQQAGQQHTKWMDDPESEEEELWCEANGTPKQQQSQPQEWKIM